MAHVIMQFVLQSAKHYINPYYYHSEIPVHYNNLYHLKDAKMLSISAKYSINAQMYIYLLSAIPITLDKCSTAKTMHR